MIEGRGHNAYVGASNSSDGVCGRHGTTRTNTGRSGPSSMELPEQPGQVKSFSGHSYHITDGVPVDRC